MTQSMNTLLKDSCTSRVSPTAMFDYLNQVYEPVSEFHCSCLKSQSKSLNDFKSLKSLKEYFRASVCQAESSASSSRIIRTSLCWDSLHDDVYPVFYCLCFSELFPANWPHTLLLFLCIRLTVNRERVNINSGGAILMRTGGDSFFKSCRSKTALHRAEDS